MLFDSDVVSEERLFEIVCIHLSVPSHLHVSDLPEPAGAAAQANSRILAQADLCHIGDAGTRLEELDESCGLGVEFGRRVKGGVTEREGQFPNEVGVGGDRS